MTVAEKPGYLDGGWKRKYRIEKADGSPVDPKAIYFVLRLDEDPCARAAIRTYAESVRDAGNHVLSSELRNLVACLEADLTQAVEQYRYGEEKRGFWCDERGDGCG